MRIGVLGTGVVGQTLGGGLIGLGHEVRMGSRSAANEAAAGWAAEQGDRASHGTFADAAGFGDLAFNCTNGDGAVPAVEAARDALRGKLLVDVSNPLDFSHGFPPTLTVTNDDSLGERVQRALPDTRVVKALNTVTCAVMVDPGRVPGDHVLFVCGEDAAAKSEVVELICGFGWTRERIVDLGGIQSARATEGYLPLWVRLMGVLGGPDFNIVLARG